MVTSIWLSSRHVSAFISYAYAREQHRYRDLTRSIWDCWWWKEREIPSRLAGAHPLPTPLGSDKGVPALAIIRIAAPIHRVSPCGTKQTKWPCSGFTPQIPFSFCGGYLPLSFSFSRFHLCQREQLLSSSRRDTSAADGSHEIFESVPRFLPAGETCLRESVKSVMVLAHRCCPTSSVTHS